MKKAIIVIPILFIIWFGYSLKILKERPLEKSEIKDKIVSNDTTHSLVACNCDKENISCPILTTESSAATSLKIPAPWYLMNSNVRLPLDYLQDKGLSPLTRWTQSFIYNHQHPSTCDKSRLLISDGHGWGFGSEMHVIGAHLAYAIQNDLVLVLSPKTCANFPTSGGCPEGCLCMLHPITHCGNDKEIFNDPMIPHIKSEMFNVGSVLPDVIVKKLKANFSSNSMTQAQIKYWWRGQSAAYLMRLNNKTMEIIYNLRHKQNFHYITGGGHVPFPLPPGTISAHIRGGDKFIEMTLVPASEYIEAIQKLITTMPNSFSRVIYASGDDQASIDEARKLTEDAGMTFIYTLIPRVTGGHHISTWRDSSVEESYENGFYAHLMQLFMTMEADTWVGTRGSNWNRLIDELRCVFVDKCQGIYVEVGKEGSAMTATYFW
jgi:hypothetical protein